MNQTVATLDIEHTDTFGGKANYSWVNRSELDIPESYSRSWIVRKVKEHVGLTGVRCNVEDYGDMLAIRPAGMCEVIFVTYACK